MPTRVVRPMAQRAVGNPIGAPAHLSRPEPSACSAQVSPEKHVSRPAPRPSEPSDELDNPLEKLPNEYFQDRKPTDPFFYPTTVSPLTTVGIRAIEKSVPHGSPTSPARHRSADDPNGPCFVSAPLQDFVEGEQMDLIQQQNDNLSRQVQALEHAKSLAAAQSQQNANQIAARNEQLRREAQFSIARARELQNETWSPQSSKFRPSITLQDEVTFEHGPRFSQALLEDTYSQKGPRRSDPRMTEMPLGTTWQDELDGGEPYDTPQSFDQTMRQHEREFGNATKPPGRASYDSAATPHSATSPTRQSVTPTRYSAQPALDSARHTVCDAYASQDGGLSDSYNHAFESAAGTMTRASVVGKPYEPRASGSFGVAYENGGNSPITDRETPPRNPLDNDIAQDDGGRGDADSYIPYDPRGEAFDELSEDSHAVDLNCALESVTLGMKSILHSKGDLAELNKVSRPNPVVKAVVEAALTIVGIVNAGRSQATWLSLRKSILDRSFIEKLKTFKLEHVTKAQFQKLRKFLLRSDYDEEMIKTHCMPIVPLSIWTRAVGVCLSLKYFPGGPEIRPVAHAMGPSAPTTPVNDTRFEEEYVVDPDLNGLTLEELRRVPELTVSRPEVASITFHGLTDCSDLHIPSVIQLEVGEVLVYPNANKKPPIGSGLNKRATVRMYQCWPPNTDIADDPSARDRYTKKIQHMTEKKSAQYIDYDCATGIWEFQVDHF